MDDPAIQWALASPFGIQIDESQNAWNSGNLNDVLELPNSGFLVASETGGVWSLSPQGAGTIPLSDSWTNPNVNSLAAGPDDPAAHFFAGCTGGIIRETDLGEAIPLLAWLPVDRPLPETAGNVRRLAIIRNLRRIIAACDNGLFWATIPARPQKRGCVWPFGPKPKPRNLYEWHQAKIDVPRGQAGFWDVAIASTRSEQNRINLEDRSTITIVAGGLSEGGVFVGQWDASDELVMRRASVRFDDGKDATELLWSDCGTSSVSSCAGRPTVLYAAVAWKDGRLNSILRSDDGGRNWVFCPALNEGASSVLDVVNNIAGYQGGDWNNCISAAPTDAAMAALGWVAGPFITVDSGKSWRVATERVHLHNDIHRLQFSHDRSTDVSNLYVCSDGGLARLDLDAFRVGRPDSYQSDYNRMLPTLQCAATYATRTIYGTLSASSQQPGIVATALQDNGNVYSLIESAPLPWTQLSGGDGQNNHFMSDGSLLSSIGESPTEVFIPTGPTTLRDTGIVPVGHPVSEAGGLASEHGGPYFVCDAVRRPTHRNGAGQLLLAVGGLRNAVYGCYPDANDSPRTYHWELIVHLPADVTITAVGSFGGGTVHVGASGSMFAVDTKQQTALKLPVDLPKPNPRAVVRAGGINRIAALSETTVFATMNGATAKTSNVVTGMPSTVTSYYVLRLDVLRWVVTPGTSLPQAALYGLEVFTALRLEAPFGVVVTTDDRAYVSRNEGASWRQASSGLPRNPHCADLRAIATRTGTSLYLSTYGRSVYVARFPA